MTTANLTGAELHAFVQQWEAAAARLHQQQQQQQQHTSASAKKHPSVPLSAKDMKDVKVAIGPPMTEEQFMAYRAHQQKNLR